MKKKTTRFRDASGNDFLRAEKLSKQYQGRVVLKSVSFAMQSGEIVGLLGPNGAGKTSCFYLILGIIAPDKGRIYLGEHNLTHQPLHHRARMGIGYLPQEASVFRQLSVQDNIMAILETRTELGQSQRERKLEDLLSEFKIGTIRHTMGAALSGGERRRVEIARALASEPQFILLDEPFAGVDPISIRDIKAIIRLLSQKGIGVLITDHNVRDTLDICDRAYILHDGQVLSEGKPKAILNNPEVRAVYLGEGFSLG